MNAAEMPLVPLPADERIQAMDVLRGFALLGILLMNIEGMVGPLWLAGTGIDPGLTGADRWADALVYVFVQGKFYPLFSLLFGMGFAVMMLRAQQAGRGFAGVYLRRTLALLAIGLAHAILVWGGDILVTYALVAFLLLLFFRNTPTSRLPKWGVVLMLLPSVFMMALGALGSLMMAVPEGAAEMEKMMVEESAAMAAEVEAQRFAQGMGSFGQAVAQRLDDLGTMLGFLLIWAWQILGLFLVGAWFVRTGAIARPQEHAGFYRGLRWVALPAGLALSLASVALVPTLDFARMDLTSSLANSMQSLGGMLMCLGYLGWIVHALQAAPSRLAWLAPAGRMALTNYLLQSLVCTWIFSGYGLGYFERLPRAWQIPFVLAFFLAQVLLSQAWLARFRMGPMEWLWRAATYLRLPPLRR